MSGNCLLYTSVSNLKPISNKININFPKNSNEEERVQKLFNEYRDGVVDSSKYGFVNGYTKARIYEDNNGMTNIVLFIGCLLYTSDDIKWSILRIRTS